MLSVNPSAASDRLSGMARRRFLERPHAHLARAADAHARLHGGDAEVDIEGDRERAVEHVNAEQSRRASAQRRDNEGRFA